MTPQRGSGAEALARINLYLTAWESPGNIYISRVGSVPTRMTSHETSISALKLCNINFSENDQERDERDERGAREREGATGV